MICYLIVCAGLLLYLDPLYGAAELIGALLVFFWYRHLSYEKFGGITGDLAGFFLQNCELFMAVCVIGLRMFYVKSLSYKVDCVSCDKDVKR